MPSKQDTHWCFTLNNWTEEQRKAILGLFPHQCKYIVVGKEVGAAGNPHLQGYINLTKKTTLAGIKKLIPFNPHFEIKQGSPKQAADYCKKDGDFEEHGELPMSKEEQGQLEKERWDTARNLAKQGKFDEIDSELMIRYVSSFQKIHSMVHVRPAMLETLEHEWWYGPTGCGKSYTAEQLPDRYDKARNKWWDGYDGQANVVIEEFGKEDVWMHSYLKTWCDRYAFSAEVKGGTKTIRPPKIIIISNWHFKELFPEEQIWQPLERKLKVKHFMNPFGVDLSQQDAPGIDPDADLIAPPAKRPCPTN